MYYLVKTRMGHWYWTECTYKAKRFTNNHLWHYHRELLNMNSIDDLFVQKSQQDIFDSTPTVTDGKLKNWSFIKYEKILNKKGDK